MTKTPHKVKSIHIVKSATQYEMKLDLVTTCSKMGKRLEVALLRAHLRHGLPHLPPLVIVSAIDEDAAHFAHSHHPLRCCQGSVQRLVLLLVRLSLLRAHHAAIHISCLCHGLRPMHGIHFLALQQASFGACQHKRSHACFCSPLQTPSHTVLNCTAQKAMPSWSTLQFLHK